jgi:hypothetical protein
MRDAAVITAHLPLLKFRIPGIEFTFSLPSTCGRSRLKYGRRYRTGFQSFWAASPRSNFLLIAFECQLARMFEVRMQARMKDS